MEFVWYTKQYYRGKVRVHRTPIVLLGSEQGRQICWNGGPPTGRWQYVYKENAETLTVTFSAHPGYPEKEHHFRRVSCQFTTQAELSHTDVWDLLPWEGSHNHSVYDTVQLMKVTRRADAGG